MAEDTGVFLVSRRIGGDFAELDVILRVSRLQNHDAVFRIKMFFHGVERRDRFAAFKADACKNAEALGLNIDFAFLALVGADLMAESVVGADEPFSIPAV